MDIFESRYYNLNERFLSMVGLWPYKKSMDRWMRRIFVLSTIFVMMIGEIINLKETWGDKGMIMKTILPAGVQLAALCKSINSIANEDKMTRLLEAMKEHWSSIDRVKENKILEKYANQGRSITVFYSIWIIGTSVLYTLIPFLPRMLDHIMPLDNGTRPYEYRLQTEYYINRDDYFLPLLAHSWANTVVVIITIVAADTMYHVYVEHACGLFDIVGYRIENLGENFNNNFDINPPKEDDKCHQELVQCIRKHLQAIEFACLIESTYCVSWLAQVGLAVVLLSITRLQVSIKIGHYGEMIRLIQIIFAQLAHLFFNSLSGQKLVNSTTDFRNRIYCGQWYFVSIRSRKLLSILMIRALKPQKITAGKLYDLSMENFGSVVQTCVSYFTIFSSIR